MNVVHGRLLQSDEPIPADMAKYKSWVGWRIKWMLPETLEGGDADYNANELVRVFTGDDTGAHRDALLMGTSLVLEVQGEANDAKDGVAQAAAVIDDGSAESFLSKLREHFDD